MWAWQLPKGYRRDVVSLHLNNIELKKSKMASILIPIIQVVLMVLNMILRPPSVAPTRCPDDMGPLELTL